MSFFSYLLLGVLSFVAGWGIREFVLSKQPKPDTPYSLAHPTIIGYLAGFFVIMLMVSLAIGQFLLKHHGIDVMFTLVNSAVATFVFSFGLSPDQARHDVPD